MVDLVRLIGRIFHAGFDHALYIAATAEDEFDGKTISKSLVGNVSFRFCADDNCHLFFWLKPAHVANG